MSARSLLGAAYRRPVALILALLFAAACLAPPRAWAASQPASRAAAATATRAPVLASRSTNRSAAALLVAHSQRLEDLRRNAEALVGPMPAVASTPFFGLAALSAAGLVAKTDLVRGSTHPWVRAFRNNALIREAQRYSNWPVLLTLAGLALVTYLANTGKVRGLIGKLLRIVEDSSSVLLYFALSLGALDFVAPPHAPTVAHLSILGDARQDLVAFGLALGLAAMVLVRYAFDVLVWLVPIPLVDFGFETLKKLLTVGFLCLYLFAPAVAAAVALLLLILAMLLAPWALRVLGFTFHLLLRPLLARLVAALRPRLLDPNLLAAHAPDRVTQLAAAAALSVPRATQGAEPAEIGGALVATHAFVLAMGGVPRRARGVLLSTAQGVFFSRTSSLGRRHSWCLAGEPRPDAPPPTLVRALLWVELRVPTTAGGRPSLPVRIALPRTFDPMRLAPLLRATYAQPPVPAAASTSGVSAPEPSPARPG